MAQPEAEGKVPKMNNPTYSLEAISVADGRYRKDVEVLSPYVSEFGLIKARTEVESKYLVALSDVGILRPFLPEETELLSNLGQTMTLVDAQRVKEIEKTSEHDVKAVENWMRERLQGTSLQDVTPYLHFLLTSEDTNNLAYRLMFQRATRDVMVPSYDRTIDQIMGMAVKEQDTVMLARTHGQDGVPTTLGKELAVFAVRMNHEVRKLEKLKLTGKFSGAVGNFNAHTYTKPDIDWLGFSKKFVEGLGFEYNPFSTQINSYEDLIEAFQTYQRLNGVVLDMDQDVWRYISDDWFTQEVKKTTTGSSTMPQKVNPIDIENSEGNVAIANGLFESMSRKLAVSRLQRDLSDSTTIRNAGLALAHSLLVSEKACKGLGKIHANYENITSAVNNNWSVLAEGVQSVLRDHGRDNAYDLVKDAIKGKKLGPNEWPGWVDELDITDEEKAQFKELTPDKYVGIAPEIVDLAIQTIAESRES